jgi:hypothetical protein
MHPTSPRSNTVIHKKVTVTVLLEERKFFSGESWTNATHSGNPHNLPLAAEKFKSWHTINWKRESGNNSCITAVARG